MWSEHAHEALVSPDDPHQQVRFDFTRDHPDLVPYMIALRTALNTSMVMRAVVPHSPQDSASGTAPTLVAVDKPLNDMSGEDWMDF